jgi:hypothetical protein
MVRRLLIGLAVAVVTVLPAVWAQEATKSSDAIKDDAALRQ